VVGNPFQPKRFDQATRVEIDRVLAGHHGFTGEGSNFIPSTKLRTGPSMKLRAGNYDIKYCMGRDTESEEE
jgi:hypothetical protein